MLGIITCRLRYLVTELENIILVGFRRKKRGLSKVRFQKISTLSHCRVNGNSQLDQNFSVKVLEVVGGMGSQQQTLYVEIWIVSATS